jgi:hypothetical protein
LWRRGATGVRQHAGELTSLEVASPRIPRKRIETPAAPKNLPAHSTGLWRLFCALAILQVADLITTYEFLAEGAHEGNVFLRELILTPTVPVLKAFALVFLALLVVRSIDHGRPAPRHLRLAMWFVLAIYTLVVANNLVILLF